MSEQMRKEFEEFAKSKGWDISHNGQHYNHIYAYYAWQGWSASRQELVVELPQHEYKVSVGWYLPFDKTVEQLDKAGVSHK